MFLWRALESVSDCLEYFKLVLVTPMYSVINVEIPKAKKIDSYSISRVSFKFDGQDINFYFYFLFLVPFLNVPKVVNNHTYFPSRDNPELIFL